MEISPLIRTRMFNSGYNANFAVYPEDFSKSDIDWAMRCVDEVMSNNQTGIRRLVASKGEKKIAGFACTLSEFVSKFLSDAEQTEAKNYTCDKRDRNIPAFLGCAFKVSGNEVPDVTPADIWNLFMEKLSDKWRREFVPAISAGYSKPKSISSTVISSEDDRLFKKYLAEAVNGDVAVIIENGAIREIPLPKPEPPKKKPQPEPPKSDIPDNRHTDERKDNRRNHIESTPTNSSIPVWLKAAPILIALGAGAYWLIKWLIR